MRKIAISDIHGCAKTFRSLLEDIVQFQLVDELYILGDYVDRGPDVKGVIDYIWELQAKGHKVFCLKGNHESMMMNARNGGEAEAFWRKYGGRETLKSFGTYQLDQVPVPYWEFMEQLEYLMEVDEFILVHAGLNFKHPDPLEQSEDMIWLRYWQDQINLEWLDKRIIVHGHTPRAAETLDISQIDHEGYLCIDCGCVFTHARDLGKLCAFDMTNRAIFLKEYMG